MGMFTGVRTRNNSINIKALYDSSKYCYKLGVWHRLCSDKLKNFEKEVEEAKEKENVKQIG